VRRSKGSGISFQPLTGFQQNDIAVSGNIFDDNEESGIFIRPSVTGTIKNLIISNNVIKNETFDVPGININPTGGAPSPENIQIVDNTINGISGSVSSGIKTTVASPTAWVIRGNLIDTFDKGFECATFPADQIYGTQCILDGNTIKNCTTGYAIGSAGAAFNGYVFNPIYINVTTKHASANYCDAVNIGNDNIELRRSAAPGAGTWSVGDRVTFLAPSAGGNIGAVCVTAGAPGTWKTFGGIAP
jgi:parallel beta-helix repeat protein